MAARVIAQQAEALGERRGLVVPHLKPRAERVRQQSRASLGSLLAGLALPAVAIPFGWRWAYLPAGALAVAAVAFAPRTVAATQAPPKRARHAGGLTSVHALGLAAVLASAAAVGFVSFLVTYAVHVGIAEATAGLLLGGVSLAATASRIGFGALTDRATLRTFDLAPARLELLVSQRGSAQLEDRTRARAGRFTASRAGSGTEGCAGSPVSAWGPRARRGGRSSTHAPQAP